MAGAPDSLVILLDGRRCGKLERGAGRGDYLFAYDEAWRDDPESFPLSLSLPLAAREHRGAEVGYYLRGLLPDSEPRLNALAHQAGTAPDDAFGLLARLGEDCPGAVQLVSPGRAAALERGDAGRVTWLTDAELAATLRSLREEGQGIAATAPAGQFSLPGALPKVALVRDAKRARWGIPAGRHASTHILKPPLGGVRDHNENEHLCLRLAAAVGLPAASSALLDVGGERAIVVERYDRIRRGERVHRLHQEDMSQALGVNPRLRYAGEGAPGAREVAGLLRDHSVRGIEDVDTFVRALAFNWVVAGTDAHPRNYSVLIAPRGLVTLAPLYDLASALLLRTRTAVDDLPLAMAIGGRTRLGAIGREAWAAEARTLRLGAPRVGSLVRELAERVREAVDGVAEEGPAHGVSERFAARFARAVRVRAQACAREMAVR